MAKQHKYERLKDFRLGSVFRQMFGHAAGTASGEAHKRIRSAFDPCYSTESVAQAVEIACALIELRRGTHRPATHINQELTQVPPPRASGIFLYLFQKHKEIY